jgi:hypothetical protein
MIVLAGINFLFPYGFWVALVCVGLGWLLMMLVSNVIGKPIIAIRNSLWHLIVGSDLDTSVQDILLKYSSQEETLSSSADQAPKP